MVIEIECVLRPALKFIVSPYSYRLLSQIVWNPNKEPNGGTAPLMQPVRGCTLSNLTNPNFLVPMIPLNHFQLIFLEADRTTSQYVFSSFQEVSSHNIAFAPESRETPQTKALSSDVLQGSCSESL